MTSGSVVISRRDVPGKQGKVSGISVEPSTLVAYVKDKLDEIQFSLLERAISFRDRFTPFSNFCLVILFTMSIIFYEFYEISASIS